MKKIQLSILVISRSQKNLDNLLESILPACGKLEFEILISWNGEDKVLIPSNLEKIVHIHTISPYNFSSNNNKLAALSASEHLLFINDDMRFDEGSIEKAYSCITLNQGIGIVGANLRYANDKIQHAGIFLNEENFPYHRYKNTAHFQDPKVIVNREVFAVTGAFILIRKDEFLQIKFDERCRVAAQDVILCIEYKNMFHKKIFYLGDCSAIHYENMTRKLFDEKTTPPEDVELMKESIKLVTGGSFLNADIKLRVVTEKPGWIMHRKGLEICKRLENAKINEDFPDANIHYYINYGYFNKRPLSGIVVANFTHFDPNLHAEKWEQVAKEVDHCIAVSEEAANNLKRFGISDQKISVIKVGADVSFKPIMTLGLVGRVYPGGRKGEDLVKKILSDKDLMSNLKIISMNSDWGVNVVNFEDSADFYRAIDYLLIPSLIEGGPVPFMEALACGTLSIAPPIGVIPEFPHIEYRTGDFDSLKSAITEAKNYYLEGKVRIANHMTAYNWNTWANEHISIFKKLLGKRSGK
jgi:hypothetical protein